jgi:hypothetical protein
MLTTEFNLETAKRIWQEEAREEVLEKVRALEKAHEEDREKFLETAKGFLAWGVPREKVAELTGLSLDIIDKLLKDCNA